MNSIKEKFSTTDKMDVDKRTRESEPVAPPGTGRLSDQICPFCGIIIQKICARSLCAVVKKNHDLNCTSII